MAHLTERERLTIQLLLNEGSSLKSIAETLGRSRTTIKREVFERAQECLVGAVGRVTNRCVHRYGCTRFQCCPDRPNCTRKCSCCPRCNTVCPDFKEELCPRLGKPPYVCNGCKQRRDCTLRKMVYDARAAQKAYRQTLVSTREGVNTSEIELLALDRLVSPLIRKGQSIHVIAVNHADELPVCEKTLYRWVGASLLGARNGDLPRRCMLKPRKQEKVNAHKVDRKCRIGRTHERYLALFENPLAAPPRVYMDTVIGSDCRETILTLHFADLHFMHAILMPDRTSASVIHAFDDLEAQLGLDLFQRLFPVVLTDNGTEFSNPTRLETSPTGHSRTRIYYCDAYNSNQKAEIERNHELLRLILPKGTSFHHLTQPKLTLAINHINSYLRASIGDATPYSLFLQAYGQTALDRLNATPIPGDEIILKPTLLTD